MEFVIKQEANNSYFVLKEEIISKREEFLLRMITENQIPGLLQVTRNQLNAEGELYYHINGYISFAEYCAKKQLGQQDVKRLLLTLQKILKQMEEYLLDADSLLIEPDSLFYSTSKESFGICLYPFIQRNVRSQIQDLGEYLLNHINHEDENVVRMTYQFYRLTREGNFEISQVVEELIRDSGSTDMENIPNKYNNNHKENIEWKDESPQRKVLESTKQISKKNFMDEVNDEELEEEKEKVENTKGIGILFLCLTLASFLYFIYTCVLKNYYYGYSFGMMMTTKEVQISLILMLITMILTGTIWWKNTIHRLDEKKGESL